MTDGAHHSEGDCSYLSVIEKFGPKSLDQRQGYLAQKGLE